MGLALAPQRTLVFVLAAMSGFHGSAHGDDLSQTYCSNENTGSDYSVGMWTCLLGKIYRLLTLNPDTSIYQSNGNCFDQCVQDYAFAIVQYEDCWCSNYIPANQVSTSECNQECPGYPSDLCGNSNTGLYGYIQLYQSASGTLGSSSASSTTSSSADSTTSTEQSVSFVSLFV